MRTLRPFVLAAAAFAALLPLQLFAKPAAPHPGQAEFVREVVAASRASGRALSPREVDAELARAVFQPGIIELISKPAEKTRPWREYRPIFMTGKRVEDGIAFYRAHRALLDEIAAKYGVPAELIVAIIGVETNYGRITGKYRVIDALATLAFYYPPRAEFFRGELKQLLLLGAAPFPKRLHELQGSYAGAMGWGQFMPTSFAKYARDHDGDGRIDLWGSKGDIFASIANYFVGYGWETRGPVAYRAQRTRDARTLTPNGYEPVYSVGQLAKWGYPIKAALAPETPATLVTLEGEGSTEYWVVQQNFYVITRYNRSPMYAMAVHQLAQAIGQGAALASTR
ncbi:MAG TPA: lytic murein transglycosylase B [Candidatus Saccharimonadia bacterium]|nr:lytic murein transglycosylase B [Candidatus Saccharimonadia bacterium]